MFIIVIIFSFIYVSFQQPCCMPRKWHAIQEMTSGTLHNGSFIPHLFKSVDKIYFDTTRRMITMDGTSQTPDGKKIRYINIQHYNSNASYNIANGHCTNGSLAGFSFPGNCLPANSRLVMTGYIGTGVQKKYVKYYEYSKYGLTATITVDNNCSTVDTTYYGINNNAYVMGFTRYTNITIGIQDESVFEIPAICHQPFKQHSNIMVDPIGKRSIPDSVLGRQ